MSKNFERWIRIKRNCKSFLKINNLNNIVESTIKHNHEKDIENMGTRQPNIKS